MKHSLTLTALVLGALSLIALGQDGAPIPEKAQAPEAKPKAVTKQVIVERDGEDGPRRGVVIVQGGDGPPDVVFLDGDALDDLELGLPGLDGHEGPAVGGRFRLALGKDGEGFDFSVDGPPSPEQLEQLHQRIRAKLAQAGIEHDIPLPPMLLDPAKRAEWTKQAAARRAELLKATQARQRQALLGELKLGAEEAAVIGPLLDKVLGERRTLAEKVAAARRPLRGAADREAARALLRDYRAQRERDEQPLEKAQAELRALLTLGQEALLVARGLLE
ncbi:MAG: hypothetical protein AB7N76_11505 [Planctomycetota bacterium]